MNTADYVDEYVQTLKNDGVPLSDVAWKAALACVGWAYVFGAWGEYCTPAQRRKRYSDDHPTIKSACGNYYGNGSSNCKGCKWYPSEKYTRIFDCRGFTYWVLKRVYGFDLQGSGATSQWNTESNWKARGEISNMPKDVLCCLFVRKDGKMQHTGFGLNNETVECSSGVQYYSSRRAKWTHWAVPACIENYTPPEPDPNQKPTLRRGDKGSYVSLLQTELVNRGYSVGSSGVDGDFGKNTEAAVKNFQRDNGLVADGVVGEKTWAALSSTDPVVLYTVHIPGLPLYKADALVTSYDNAYMTKE